MTSSSVQPVPFSTGVELHQYQTVIHLLEEQANRLVDQPFVSCLDHAGLSYAEAFEGARRFGAALRGLGVRPGEAVAMLIHNRPEAVLLWFGCSAIGAIDAQLNWQLRGEMLARQLRDTGAAVVIVEGSLLPELLAAVQLVPGLRVVATVGPVARVDGHGRIEIVALDDLVAAATPGGVDPGESSAITTIVYTGGTTGASKGCAISHSYALSAAERFATATALDRDDITWTPLPLYHVNAKVTTVIGTLTRGGRAAFSQKFSVTNFWRHVGEAGATRARIISTMIPLIADGPDAADPGWTATLRQVIGSPVTAEAAARFRERWGIIAWSPGYGLTELLWATGPDRPGEPIPAGTLGRVHSDMDIRLVDDEGLEVGVGRAGEITVRPRHRGLMFSGYWRDPEATWAACRDLWFATGDTARLEEDGRYYFVGRKNDSIRRKGENIACAEVEAAIRRHADVEDVAVFGLPAALAEHEVAAWVVLRRTGRGVQPDDLHRWCEANLPRYVVPRYFRFVTELPRQEFGRVLKNVMRTAGVDDETWDSERR